MSQRYVKTQIRKRKTEHGGTTPTTIAQRSYGKSRSENNMTKKGIVKGTIDDTVAAAKETPKYLMKAIPALSGFIINRGVAVVAPKDPVLPHIPIQKRVVLSVGTTILSALAARKAPEKYKGALGMITLGSGINTLTHIVENAIDFLTPKVEIESGKAAMGFIDELLATPP